MSTTFHNEKAEDIDPPMSPVSPSQKKARRSLLTVNPVKAVSKGVTEGISQVEKGVNLAGNTLNKVPGVKHGVSFFSDYRKFMDRGNVIDLAVAVVVGAAFTSIVTSLVNDIITPILALASGKNLEENFITLRKNNTDSPTYPTRDLAHAAGDITWNWGNFIQTVINFFIISGCVFLVVKRRNTKTEVTEKPCDYCYKKVPIKAVRCPECTTWLDWDACTKAANMERIAAFGGFKPPVDTPFVDTPTQSSSVHF